MTQEDSIRTKTWVTNDGRYLTVDEITSDHLHNIRGMLLSDLHDRWNCPEYYGELDLNSYAAAWIQIIDDELLQRS